MSDRLGTVWQENLVDVYEPSFSFRTLRDRSATRRQDAAAVWYQLLGERIVYENAAGALVTWEP